MKTQPLTNARTRWLGATRSLATLLLGFVLGVAAQNAGAELQGHSAEAELEPVSGLDPSAEQPGAESLASPSNDPSQPRALVRQAIALSVYVRAESSYGSGVLLDHEGHVLTCQHVLKDRTQANVSFSGGLRTTAHLVDSDPDLDLALLKVQELPADLPRLASVGSPRELEAGNQLLNIGSPRNLRFTLARGMLAHPARRFGNVLYHQTDLPSNRGSSGGPVFSEQGQLVGVTSFVLKKSEGISLALPALYAYERFSQHLGVEQIDAENKRKLTEFAAWKKQNLSQSL